MNENSDQEIDIAALMTKIREAAEKRKSNSLIDASSTLYRLLKANGESGSSQNGSSAHAPAISPFSLQPTFEPRDRYHVNDLLSFHDETFVRNAYKAILNREPDEAGFARYLQELRGGHFNKIDVLASLRFSPEGRLRNTRIKGLAAPRFLRRLYRVPVVGYFIELAVAIVRLPILITNVRALEAYSAAQFERLSEYVYETQRKIAELHHQQIKGLIREQHEQTEDQNSLKNEISAHLMATQNQFKQEAIARGLHDDELQRLRELIETKVIGRVQQTRRQLVLQERRLTLFLEEARKRLPEPLEREQLETFEEEKDHLLDSLYAALEDEFRGTREDIKELLKFYLPILQEAGISSDILDVGCGRGEFLEVLKEAGLSGRGVDSNRVMVERCSRLGLDVFEADALSYLQEQADKSLNCITAFHFAEHLPLATLVRFLDEVARVLKPGGYVILETPDPENLMVGSYKFYLDPTHRNPIPSATMQFLLETRGFSRVKIFKLHPPAPRAFKGSDELSKELNQYFFGPMNYAIIARTT